MLQRGAKLNKHKADQGTVVYKTKLLDGTKPNTNPSQVIIN